MFPARQLVFEQSSPVNLKNNFFSTFFAFTSTRDITCVHITHVRLYENEVFLIILVAKKAKKTTENVCAALINF